MEVLKDGSVGGGLDGAVGKKVGGNGVVAEGLKGLFLGPRERRTGDYIVSLRMLDWEVLGNQMGAA
jgi:hypothetical protein